MNSLLEDFDAFMLKHGNVFCMGMALSAVLSTSWLSLIVTICAFLYKMYIERVEITDHEDVE